MYGVSGVPHAQFQGVSDVVGGGIDMLPSYTNKYNNFINNESPFEIDLDFGIANQEINLSANVTVTGNVSSEDDNSVFFMVTYEYSDSYSCSVQRYAEVDFDLTEIDDNGVYETSFALDTAWNLENIRAIAMIQKTNGTTGNYPIHQAAIATVNSSAYVPNNLTAVMNENSVELNWELPMILPYLYSVYRNGEFYSSVDDPQQTTFLDPNVENGVSYEYYLTSLGNTESDPSNTIVIVAVDNNNDSVQMQNKLIGNYPNPFNPNTSIMFSLTNSENVMIEIFNVKGELIKTLVNEVFESGNHQINWNGMNDNINKLANLTSYLICLGSSC